MPCIFSYFLWYKNLILCFLVRWKSVKLIINASSYNQSLNGKGGIRIRMILYLVKDGLYGLKILVAFIVIMLNAAKKWIRGEISARKLVLQRNKSAKKIPQENCSEEMTLNLQSWSSWYRDRSWSGKYLEWNKKKADMATST